MEWADGLQPVRQTVGCGKWVAVSLLTYRDCRHFLCGGSEVIGGLFFLYSLLRKYSSSSGGTFATLNSLQVPLSGPFYQTDVALNMNPPGLAVDGKHPAYLS